MPTLGTTLKMVPPLLPLLVVIALASQPAAHAVAAPAAFPTTCPPSGTCKAHYAPVCGADGNTYINACLPACQRIQVLAKGPCTGAAAIMFAEHAAAAEAVTAATSGSSRRAPVTDPAELARLASYASTVIKLFDRTAPERVIKKSDMQRYANEGMVLVGVLKLLDDFDPEADPKLRRVPRKAIGSFASASPDQEYEAAAAMVVTSMDGFVYKRASLAGAVAAARASLRARSSSSSLSTPAFVPALADKGGGRLAPASTRSSGEFGRG